MPFLVYAAIFLTAAAVAAPLAKRIGLGAVLGYLAAGVAIGPSGLGLIYGFHEIETVMHTAEFGVVLLLFVIGLELRPRRLWALRSGVFGLGLAQVLVTGALIAAAAHWLGLAFGTAILVGLTLAMSSTAFALQTLAERGQMQAPHGRSAFAILLAQDIAVIPILALLPVLAGQGGVSFDPLAAARAILVVAAVVVIGRYVLRYVYRLVASVGVREALTASALLTIVGVALLMQAAGLSAGLGAFLAGVLLADSEFRHELEADIAPFESLLLGIFFIAIGMSLDVSLIAREPLQVLGLTLGLLALKALVLGGLGLARGLAPHQALLLAAAIPQGGEFAFVILNQASGQSLLEPALANLLSVVVTLSMVATPFLLTLASRAMPPPQPVERPYDTPPDDEPPVIIAGFGRFGQIIARVLRAKGIRFTALDKSIEQVDFVSSFGNKIYYGDASRLDLLHAAGAGHAKAFVLAIDNVEDSLQTAALLRRHFPDLKIYARARDRQHAHRLIDLGVPVVRRELFLASLDMTREVLEGLGVPPAQARQAIETFRNHDRKRLYDEYEVASDEEKIRERALRAAEELEQLFRADMVDMPTETPEPAKQRRAAS